MKISFEFTDTASNADFRYYSLLPTITFVVDRQLEDSHTSEEFGLWEGIIEYSVMFSLLRWTFSAFLVVKSGK